MTGWYWPVALALVSVLAVLQDAARTRAIRRIQDDAEREIQRVQESARLAIARVHAAADHDERWNRGPDG